MFTHIIRYLNHRVLRLAQKQKLTDLIDRILLRNKDFCIVSNNCWNLGIYRNLRKPYNTPFVGLVVTASDFIKLAKNITHYMSIDINESHFIPHKEHPVANLDGINIYFVHYKDIDECVSKWNRRKERLNAYVREKGVESIIFKCCDIDSKNQDCDFENFMKLRLKRSIFLQKKTNQVLLGRACEIPAGPELYAARILYYKKFISLFKGLR